MWEGWTTSEKYNSEKKWKYLQRSLNLLHWHQAAEAIWPWWITLLALAQDVGNRFVRAFQTHVKALVGQGRRPVVLHLLNGHLV